MTVRDELGFAASPTIELVSAGRLQKMAKSFGRTRLIGMSTPGTNITGTNGGCAFDYPQSRYLRICLVAQRASGVQTSYPEINIDVKTRSETGGPSLDYPPGGQWAVGYDPVSWVGVSQSDWGEYGQMYRDGGYHFEVRGTGGVAGTGPHPEQLFWIQLSLITPFLFGFTPGIGGTASGAIASPTHNKLWLNITPEANIGYVRNVLIWEWPPHSGTPVNQSGGFLFSASDHSENMGSKYDIFTGS